MLVMWLSRQLWQLPYFCIFLYCWKAEVGVTFKLSGFLTSSFICFTWFHSPFVKIAVFPLFSSIKLLANYVISHHTVGAVMLITWYPCCRHTSVTLLCRVSMQHWNRCECRVATPALRKGADRGQFSRGLTRCLQARLSLCHFGWSSFEGSLAWFKCLNWKWKSKVVQHGLAPQQQMYQWKSP